MTKARDIADFKFENIVDTGTEGTKVATGTTAQRGSTTGQWRYNSTTGFFEGRNANGEFSTLEPTPTVSSVDVSEVDSQAGGNQTFVITGNNFTSGGTIKFIGNAGTDITANTTTHNSGTQQTAVAPKASFLNAQEPYKIRYTSSSGLQGTSATGLINVDTTPTWSTASGQVGGDVFENLAMTNTTLTATDADNDTIAYSIQSGALPTGISLNSSTGVLSGTPTTAISSDTTYSFTARATANSKTADRAFNIIVKNANLGHHAGVQQGSMSGGTAWFDSGNSYHGIEVGSSHTFAAGDLITQFQTRKSGTGTQDFWTCVYEGTSTTNGYVIIAAWKFSYTNSEGNVMTHLCSNATQTVTHNGISLASGNKFVIPSSSTTTNGTGTYYLGWIAKDGSGSGSLYVDTSGLGNSGNINYIDTSTLASNLSLSDAKPDDLSSGTVVVFSNIGEATGLHINASGS